MIKFTNTDQLVRLGKSYRPGTVNIIAGRPAMGKTTLALEIALSLGEHVAFFSIEMTKGNLLGNRIWNSRDWDSIDLLHVDDHPQVSLEYLQIQALELKELFGIRLVVIDYLQLLQIESTPSHQDWRMIAEGLQNLAITLDAPVLVISQLKRRIDEDNGDIPTPNDIPGWTELSGHITEVGIIYRPAYYFDFFKNNMMIYVSNHGSKVLPINSIKR